MRQNIGNFPIGIVLALLITLSLHESCTKPSLIGNDLLPPEDNINVFFTDTLSIISSTVREDSIRTYSPNTAQQLGNYQIGRLVDPVFGTSKAEVYAQLRLLTTTPQFNEATLDSAIFSLTFRNNGVSSGNVNQPQTISVYQVTEALDATSEYFSNKTFSTASNVLGQVTQIARPNDTLLITEPSGDTIADFQVLPQIRIPLDPSFGNSILTTPGILDDTEAFLAFFKGVHVKSDDNDEAIFGYDLANSGITLYYTNVDSIFDTDNNFERLDTIGHKFQFGINTFSAKMVHYEHDITGTRMEQGIGNTSDSLMFVQSMAGVNGQFTIPYLGNLGNIIVNKAELIATVADTTNLLSFSLPEQILALEQGATSNVLIEDIVTSIEQGQSFSLFDGTLTTETINGETRYQYKMNITGHLQSIIDGLTEDNNIYLSTYPKSQVPNRIIFGGGVHSQVPLKLNLTFTKIE